MRVLWLLLFASLPQAESSNGFCFIEKDEKVADIFRQCPDSQVYDSKNLTLDISKESEEDLKKLFGRNDKNLILRSNLRLVNSSIQTLDFSSISVISGDKTIEIRGNRNLTKIELPTDFSIGSVKYFVVSGNPKMEKETLERLRVQLTNRATPVPHYIQEEGECKFDGPVTDASQLKDCKYIHGDLILESYHNKSVPVISKITGCLIIKNTLLDNIKFLKLTQKGSSSCDGKESEISGNPNLWIHPRDQMELRASFGDIKIVMDPNAGADCTPKQSLDANYLCTKVVGDLIITCASGESLNSLQLIRKVQGFVQINGSDCKELIFPELTEIIASTDPPLMVTNNPNLERIELPKITDFLTYGSIAMRFSGNPKLVLGEGQYEKLKGVSNNKKIEFECNLFAKPISDISSINHCTSVNGDLLLKGTTGSTSTKIEYITGCLEIVDTELTDLSFLSLNVNVSSTCSGKSQISGNKNFCLSMTEFIGIQSRLGHSIEYTPDNSCDRTCNQTDFLQPSSFCENLDEDLLISGIVPDSPMLELMKKVKVINGKLTISGNIGVDIEFPELSTVNNSESNEAAIDVSGNTDSKTFSMPKLKSAITNGTIAVSLKDYQISKDQAEILDKASNGKGFLLECNFGSTPISKLSEMDYCTSVKGDLLLHNTEGVTSSRIEGISGCLQIIGTKLENLEFLTNLETGSTTEICLSVAGTSEIKENKNLCSTGDKMLKIQRNFGKKIGWDMEEKCEISCSFAEQLELNNACTVLKGRVGILENSDESKVKEALKKVRTVNGYIQIENIKFSNLDFPKLEKINASAGVGLTVADNGHLKELTFPKLKSLIVKGSRAVAITRNEGFRLSVDLKTLLEKLIGEKEMIYECHESNPISDFSTLSGCNRLSSDLKLLGNVAGSPQKLILVAGCVQIENTTLELVDFLDLKEKSGLVCKEKSCKPENITGNKNLILSTEKSKDLMEKIANLTISDNKPEEIIVISSTGSPTTVATTPSTDVPPTDEIPAVVTSDATSSSVSTSIGSSSTGTSPSESSSSETIPTQPSQTSAPSSTTLEETSSTESTSIGSSSSGTSPSESSSSETIPSEPSAPSPTTHEDTSSTGSTTSISTSITLSPKETGATCAPTDGKLFQSGCKFIEGDLIVEDQCSSLTYFKEIEEIRGHLSIKECSLESIRAIFPKLKKFTADSGVLLSLNGIEGDLKITEFKEIEFVSNDREDVVLKIDTKTAIPFLEAADFQTDFGKKRVELMNVEKTPEGVCLFLDPAVEVSDCSKIEGDLILDENTVRISNDLKEITGCLIMKNTKLGSYDFLSNIEDIGEKCRWSDKNTEISDNSCIPYKVRKVLKGKIGEGVDKGENKKDCHECPGKKMTEDKCEVILGDLVVTGSPSDQFLDRLTEVKEIYGSFVVKDSTVTSISMKKLAIVDKGEAEETAIEIFGNPNLTTLDFPSLTSAVSKGRNLIKIAKNNKLDKTETLQSQLKQVAGEACKDDVDAICYFSTPKSKSSSSAKKQAQKLKGEKDQEKEEEGLNATMIALIIGGVIVLITICIILVLVAVVMRNKRKEKKSKEGEGGKKKGKKTSEIVERDNPSPMDTPKKEPVEKPTKTKTGSKEPAVDPLAETVVDGHTPAV